MSAHDDLRVEAERLKAGLSLTAIIGANVVLKRVGRDVAGPCPFHAERNPSFIVYRDHYHCFGCGAHGDVWDWCSKVLGMKFPAAVEYLGGGKYVRAVALEPSMPEPALAESDYSEAARRIWMEAVDPAGTPAETYLKSRGLALPEEPVIRFHPRCPSPFGKLPAMIARMDDPRTEQPLGVHRTLIMPDGAGKADVVKPKLMLGRAGVIRLYEWQGDGLGLAEGIETALSIAQRFQWKPVWAAGSAGMIKTFPVLDRVTLTAFADCDDSGVGLAAAREVAARYAEARHESHVMKPPTGSDWHDAARALT